MGVKAESLLYARTIISSYPKPTGGDAELSEPFFPQASAFIYFHCVTIYNARMCKYIYVGMYLIFWAENSYYCDDVRGERGFN